LGVRLEGVTLVPGGQRRTYAGKHRGRPVVLKWGLDRDLPEKIPYVAAQTSELLRRGVPAPLILGRGRVDGGGYAWMRERLPGHPPDGWSPGLTDELFALLESRRVRGWPGKPPEPRDDCVLLAHGRGDEGWRQAVACEVVSRRGWRSRHPPAVDPGTLVDTAAAFFSAVAVAEA
jgi:hypothetical protein